MGLRKYLDNITPHFEKGGKYEKYYTIFEMVETLLYTRKQVTQAAPHARDFIDLKRVMTYVVLATIPCILMALYNTGLQTNQAIQQVGIENAVGWRVWILNLLHIPFNPGNIFANLAHGALFSAAGKLKFA